MEYVLVGVLGFFAGYGFEIIPSQRIRGVKPLLGFVSGCLIMYSIAMVCLTSERFWLPDWVVFTGWVLLPFVVSLFVRSLFFELPFKVILGISKSKSYLVTTGSYSVVRHPTVPLLLLLLLSLLMISRSSLLFAAIPVWISMDVVWAMIQERFVLLKKFPKYCDYQKSTPMLIPNLNRITFELKKTRLFKTVTQFYVL
jgi:protein-S-isoprenylcysteine O-methyltransferase Ste14